MLPLAVFGHVTLEKGLSFGLKTAHVTPGRQGRDKSLSHINDGNRYLSMNLQAVKAGLTVGKDSNQSGAGFGFSSMRFELV